MDQTGFVALLLESSTLKWMPRAGWQMRGVPRVESVADHSFGVAVMALAVADALEEEGRLREALDLGRVLAMAVLHDLGEVRLTDLPASANELLTAEVKGEAESRAIGELLEPLPSARRWKAIWREFEEASSPEGRLVCDVDKLEMMVQCLRYEMAGSRGLDEFWRATDRLEWNYPLCEELYGHLKSIRQALVTEAESPGSSAKRPTSSARRKTPAARKPGSGRKSTRRQSAGRASDMQAVTARGEAPAGSPAQD